MFKVLALSTVAVVASAFPHFKRAHKEVAAVGTWPEINFYPNAQAEISLHQWNGSKLTPYQEITATAKLDSDRNKIRLDAKVKVPVIGSTKAVVVVDLNVDAPTAYEYVPALRLCQSQALPKNGVVLKDLLQTIFSEQGGISTYEGESSAPWDPTTLYKFHAAQTVSTYSADITAYVDETTKNPRWVQEKVTGAKIPELVISVESDVPATFQDSDFVIDGCTTFNSIPEEYVSIFW